RRGYGRLLVGLLRWRGAVLLPLIALLAWVAWAFTTKVPRFTFGRWWGEQSYLIVRLGFPRGSDPVTLDRAARDFERAALGAPGVSRVTARGSDVGAQIRVDFTFEASSGPLPYLLKEELTARAVNVGGADVAVWGFGPGFSSGSYSSPSYSIRVLGYEYAGVERLANDLADRLRRIPRVREVDPNAGSRYWQRDRAHEIVLVPDRAALARAGFTAQDFAGAVAQEIAGPVGAVRLVIGGEELPVILKAAGAETRALHELEQALVQSPRGPAARVASVARVAERRVLPEIVRENQQYQRVLTYEFRGPQKLGDRVYKSVLAGTGPPPGYAAVESRWWYRDDESSRGLWLVFGIAVALVLLATAAVYDSVWVTAMVLVSLPLAFAGVAGAFLVADAAFTREAAVGVILVVGLAVNQVIILAGAARRRRRAGAGPVSAALGAARETAGVVVLTGLATVASLVPLAWGTALDTLFGAIALATAGGTVASTAATVFVLPLVAAGSWRVPRVGEATRTWTRVIEGLKSRSLMITMPPVALLLLGCGGAERGGSWAGSVDTLPNSTIIVSNPETGIWDSASTWRIEEELRIGSAGGEGPESFNSIVAIEVDPFDRVWVLDRETQDIRVFDAAGRHIRTVGRKGRGPGEFQEAVGLAWDPQGRLWVVDQRNVRYTLLDTSGQAVADSPRPVSGFFSTRWLGGLGTDGAIYELHHDFGSFDRPVLLRYDSTLASPDTLRLPPAGDIPRFELARSGMRMTAGVPYAPFQLRYIDRRGYLWSGLSAPYRIHQSHLGGDTIRIVEKAYEPIPVSAEDKDSAVARLKWFTDQGGKIDPSRIPDVKPALDDYFVDDRGNLWVDPVTGREDDDRVFDLFDSEGRYLGRVRSDFPIAGEPVFRGDRLYAVTRDEDDIPYVVRVRIVRP
ncbi:MAG: efflux RND transporter permease subunit, partial [Gemmatimonadales bacterium]